MSNVYEAMPFEQLEPLLPAILEATMEPAPSGIMFADGVRVAGLELLVEHRIEEGIAACVHYVRHQKQHGSEKRTPQVLELLRRYGAHAQAVVPDLERIAAYFEDDERDFPKHLSRGKAAAVRAAIAAIQAAEDRPELTRLR